MLATEPGHKATVDVALAGMGSTPVKISAGKEMKLPPPATEFKMPARVAATNNNAAWDKVMFWAAWLAGSKGIRERRPLSFWAPSGPAHRCPRSWRLISVRSEIRESPAGCQRFQTSFCRLVFLRRIHVSKNVGGKAGTGDFRPRNHAANHGREK